MTFLGSAILLAWTDKIMQKDKKHSVGNQNQYSMYLF